VPATTSASITTQEESGSGSGESGSGESGSGESGSGGDSGDGNVADSTVAAPTTAPATTNPAITESSAVADNSATIVTNKIGRSTNLGLILAASTGASGRANPWAKCIVSGCRHKFADESCDPECNIPACGFDGDDCFEPSTCAAERCRNVHNNGACDPECNRRECLFDGGECAARGGVAGAKALQALPQAIIILLEGAVDEINAKLQALEWDLGKRLDAIVHIHRVRKMTVERLSGGSSGGQPGNRRRRASDEVVEATFTVQPLCNVRCFETAQDILVYLNSQTASGQLSGSLGIVSLGASLAPSAEPTSNLSSAATAGIVVGAVLVVLLVGVFVVITKKIPGVSRPVSPSRTGKVEVVESTWREQQVWVPRRGLPLDDDTRSSSPGRKSRLVQFEVELAHGVHEGVSDTALARHGPQPFLPSHRVQAPAQEGEEQRRAVVYVMPSGLRGAIPSLPETLPPHNTSTRPRMVAPNATYL